MEAKAVGVGIGIVVPIENIPVDQLPEHANDLANQRHMAVEQLQAIKYLYELAVNENADLQKALNENIQGDVQFADGFQEAFEASTKKNALLEMEIIHLKNQKFESDKAAKEKDKSAQERIFEVEKENKSLKDLVTVQGKAIETFERVTQEVKANQIQMDDAGRLAFYMPYGGIDHQWHPMLNVRFRKNYFKFHAPRWEILKNQVEETRLQQQELLKAQIEDKAIDQNIKL